MESCPTKRVATISCRGHYERCRGSHSEIMKKRFGVVLALLIGLVAATGAESDYAKSIEKWRSDKAQNLKKENGWLTVAGLFWLREGTNTVGTGPEFDVRLTDSFKKGKFGEIDFKNGSATLKVESGVEALSDGKQISSIELVSDEKGKPTEVRTGSQSFYLIKREDRFGIRLKDNKSEARQNFKGQHWFAIDEAYKVTARFEASPNGTELSVPNILGGHFKMKSPGLLKFSLKGKEYALTPVVEEGDDVLFIIFRDQSNEKETYKAGRFLYADMPVNGETTLDFNKAENPPCAFTPFATCPLPPQQNNLAVEVNAGEKRYDH
jgi:uncharacterized protein (DUF1684 family)